MILLGSISVIPMIIYDLIYERKTHIKANLPTILKNSYIINTFANIGGGGGMIGATLRIRLFGQASSKITETLKIVSQIALFTVAGLMTNDILALLLNIRDLDAVDPLIKLACLLFLLYIFVPFLIPTHKLDRHDHIWLIIGSSLEWIFALGFFLLVGFLSGYSFSPEHIYLVIVYAGIIGVISFLPGGAGSFDSALILGMHQFGISASMALAWDMMYRICYYIVPFLIGTILMVYTIIISRIKSSHK